MPRVGGIYSRPPGTDAVPDTTIESAKYNTNVADVEFDLNLPRPIAAGGTGASSADQALLNLSGEKAKQIVASWDATVWMAGSFYAATTATGIAPVSGHAFAGIAYYANATDFVLEATDLTDVSDPTNVQQYIRVMTAGVWGAWTRKVAIAPIPGSLGDYTFDSGITFPPGVGQIRFNNATQNSTTEIFISHTTATGIDNSGVIPFSLRAGYDLYVQDKDEPAKWKIFTTTVDPVLSGGDFRITATFKSGGTDVATAQRMLVGANSGAAVRYDVAQTLTSTQQARARSNIGAKKNYVINGAMQINQGAYLSGAVLAAGAYGHDQWKAGASGGDYTFTQSNSVTTITIITGKSLIQPIEDVMVVGGGNYVLAWTGTAQARAGVNTLVPSGTYAASPLLITGQTDGVAMSVEFNAGTLGGVTLTEGTVASPFQVPNYAQELAACQRYYRYDLVANEGQATITGQVATTALNYGPRMRAPPTVATGAAILNVNTGSPSFVAVAPTTAYATAVSASSSTGRFYWYGTVSSSARL